MEVMQAIETRSSIRHYKTTPVEEKDLRDDLVDEYGTVGKYCYVSKDATITLFI